MQVYCAHVRMYKRDIYTVVGCVCLSVGVSASRVKFKCYNNIFSWVWICQMFEIKLCPGVIGLLLMIKTLPKANLLSQLIYNLTVRFILQRSLVMIFN